MMAERSRWLDMLLHVVIVLGVVLVGFRFPF